MEWWNDLWLNESFATWLACKIVDQWRPEWLSWQEFQQEKQIPLALDALRSSRPIVADVTSPAEIEAMFDPLTYEKGAAVLRMLEQFLGETAFRGGIRAYMQRHQFKNTVADDLWRELEQASGRPIGAIARDWLTQAGYPIIAARVAGREPLTIVLEQRRFDAHGERRPGSWTVPMVLRFGDGTEESERVLLRDATQTVALPRATGGDATRWVYPNGAEAGFFRVSLDPALAEALKPEAATRLEPAERIGLLNHVWAQAQARETSIETFLEWLVAFRSDGTRVVLEAVASYVEALHDRLAPEALRPRVGRLADELLTAHARALGWDPAEGENDERRLARAAVYWALGALNPAPDLAEANDRRLAAYLAAPAGVDPTLVTPMLRIAARYGDAARFELFLERLRKAGTPEERDRFLVALSEFRQPALARRLLELTLTDEMRGQDLWKPVRLLLGNTAVQAEAWAFAQQHWQALRDKTGPVGAMRIIQATRALLRPDWLEQVRRFFAAPNNRVESAEKAFEQTLEFLELGLAFRAAQAEKLAAWLRRRYPT
jgi:puromycin-sensitive aminopeptidase